MNRSQKTVEKIQALPDVATTNSSGQLWKRVFQLEVNDVFTYMNVNRRVVRIENGFIYYCNQNAGKNDYSYFGWRSQQRVEFLYKAILNP